MLHVKVVRIIHHVMNVLVVILKKIPLNYVKNVILIAKNARIVKKTAYVHNVNKIKYYKSKRNVKKIAKRNKSLLTKLKNVKIVTKHAKHAKIIPHVIVVSLVFIKMIKKYAHNVTKIAFYAKIRAKNAPSVKTVKFCAKIILAI